MKRNNSISTLMYIFMLFAVILSLAIILMQVLYFDQRAQKVALSNGLNKTLERESVIEDYLDVSNSTLLAIRTSRFFSEYLNNPIEKESLEELFLNYAMSNTEFMQIRYIDVEGVEKVRVQRNVFGQEPVIISESDLQDKSHRYYFQESIKRPLEELWFTPIDLNYEEEEVVIPYVPTMRAVLPVEYNNEYAGIIVINYFASPLIDKLTNAPLYDMILCDYEGDVLYHYKHKEDIHDKCWGNSLEHQYNISMEFPDNYEEILEASVLEKGDLVSRHFNVPLENGLIMILQLRESYVVEEEQRMLREYITIFIIIFLFSIMLTYLIIKFFGRILMNLDKVSKLNDSLNIASKIAKIGFYEFKPKSQEIYWYKGIEEVFDEAEADEMMTFGQFLVYVPEEDQELFLEELKNSVDNRCELFISHRLKMKNGEFKYVEERVKHEYDRSGNHIYSVGSIYDITSLKRIQKELEDSKLRWQFAVEGNKDGLWDWKTEKDEIYFSDQCFTMLGYAKDEIESTLDTWRGLVHPEDLESMLVNINGYVKGERDTYINEHRLLCKDGSYIWIRDRGIVIERDEDDRTRRLIGTMTDITEYVEALKKIQEQVNIDSLTQLQNRHAYNKKLHELIEMNSRYSSVFSMILMDIDLFKSINDTYGHSVGDQVLIELGGLLKSNVRENDEVFRIGGEEILILANGSNKENAVAFAEKIRKLIQQELGKVIDENREITVSIGVTEFRVGDTGDSIFSRADKSLYLAKDKGRNNVVSE